MCCNFRKLLRFSLFCFPLMICLISCKSLWRWDYLSKMLEKFGSSSLLAWILTNVLEISLLIIIYVKKSIYSRSRILEK